MTIIAALKDSPIVKEFHILDLRLYSYHWQTKDGELLLRWDNAPHHKSISTYPHHKHCQGKVPPNFSITCEEILKEIEAFIHKRDGG